MTDETLTLAKLGEFACENLPEGWILAVNLRFGTIAVILWNPDREMVEPQEGEVDVAAMVLRRVNLAREEDGLGPVDWDGNHDPDYDDGNA